MFVGEINPIGLQGSVSASPISSEVGRQFNNNTQVNSFAANDSAPALARMANQNSRMTLAGVKVDHSNSTTSSAKGVTTETKIKVSSAANSLLETAADVTTDFIPGVSNLKDASIALTGENPVTGEKVGVGGRVAAGLFAVPVLGNGAKYAVKGGKLALKAGAFIAVKGGELAIKAGKSIFNGLGKLFGSKAAVKTLHFNADKQLDGLIKSKGFPVRGEMLEKGERLKIYSDMLKQSPPATNAMDAFQLLDKNMNAVEDAYSGVKKVDNPGLKYEGRMYSPREDYTTKLADGSITAETKGNFIKLSKEGDIAFFIKEKDGSQGAKVFFKAGGK